MFLLWSARERAESICRGRDLVFMSVGRLRVAVLACLGFGAVAALCGCDLGPNYKQPGLELPAAYKATPESANAAWPSTDWWRGFGSPELDQLIADTHAYNFDIQAAIARVRQADAQVRISGAPLLPTVDANGQYSWERAGFTRSSAGARSGGKRYIETRNYNTGLSASYEVDLWGRIHAQQESAEASALASRFDQETVALTVVTSVASTWFQALAFKDRLDVLERNLRDARAILGAIQGRLDAGTASQLDVAQQASLVQGLEANVPVFRSELEQQLNGLGILTGKPPEAITAQPGTLTKLSLPPVDAGIPSELLARRPDVQFAEAQLIAANANIKFARANFFPQISLTGSEGLESTALSMLTGPGSMLTTFTASVVQTVFDNGLKGGQYDLTKAQYEELVAVYRKSVVQALTDVEDALVAYKYATQQESLEQVAVNTAQQAADIARAQLAAGTIDIVTSLQVQTTLFGDLDLLVQARLARFQALLSLYKALGGGWTKGDVTIPPSTIFHGIL
jgi:NodT family efflux transporter outer membrane factor (OMF) lipoprotein